MTPDPTALASRIADQLLTNGFGDVGERLVIELPGKRDGGGWSRAAIVGVVEKILREVARG